MRCFSTLDIGYRAPYFSVTHETPWAPDVIRESGFRYSSSVLPGRSNQFAFRGAPRTPFRWPNGLVEFPVPVLQLPGLSIPVIGGGYLRLLPSFMIERQLRLARRLPLNWTYCHPYDFDGPTHLPSTPGFLLQHLLTPALGEARFQLLQFLWKCCECACHHFCPLGVHLMPRYSTKAHRTSQ